MENLKVNALVEWGYAEGQKRIERLLWVSPDGEQSVFIPVLGSRAWPFARPTVEVTSALEHGRAKSVELKDCPPAVRSHLEIRPKLSDAQRRVQEDAWKVIEPLVANGCEAELYDSKRSGTLIRTRAAECGKHKPFIYKYLRKWWQRGRGLDSIQPDYRKCGGPGSRHKRGTVKLGPKPNKGVNVTLQDEENFESAIQTYFYRRKLPLGTAYRSMLGDHYSTPRFDVEGNKLWEIRPAEQIPTLRQFQFYFQKKHSRLQVLQNLTSELDMARKFRPVLGSQPLAVFHPGAVYQIDSTVVDLNLVHSLYPVVLVGRPKLYWVIDQFSTMIVGFYVGFENAAYNTAALALWNAFRNKVDVCKDYGVTISGAQWPVEGLPAKILADRGELLSMNAENLGRRLGIGIANTAPYRADLKGLVERHFRLHNDRAFKYLPGAVDASGDPSKPDERRKAALNIHSFTRIVLTLIWEWNTSSKDEYPLTPEMVADGFKVERAVTPLNLWNWGKKKWVGMFRDMDPTLLKLQLFPAATASFTADGLRLNNLYYTCPSGVNGRFTVARKDGSEKVDVLYDPFLVDRVYVVGKTAADMEVAELTKHSSGHAGRSWEEYIQWSKKARERDADVNREDMQRKNTVDEINIREVAAAKTAQGKQPVDVNVVAVAQKHERDMSRAHSNQTQAALLGHRETPVETTPQKPSTRLKRSLDILKQQNEEAA